MGGTSKSVTGKATFAYDDLGHSTSRMKSFLAELSHDQEALQFGHWNNLIATKAPGKWWKELAKQAPALISKCDDILIGLNEEDMQFIKRKLEMDYYESPFDDALDTFENSVQQIDKDKVAFHLDHYREARTAHEVDIPTLRNFLDQFRETRPTCEDISPLLWENLVKEASWADGLLNHWISPKISFDGGRSAQFVKSIGNFVADSDLFPTWEKEACGVSQGNPAFYEKWNELHSRRREEIWRSDALDGFMLDALSVLARPVFAGKEGTWREVGTKIEFVEIERKEQHTESKKTSGGRGIEDATPEELRKFLAYINGEPDAFGSSVVG